MNRVHLRDCVIAGVLYAEDFDQISVEPVSVRQEAAALEADTRSLPPSFSLDEFQAATRQAFDDGREFERGEKQASLERQLSACISGLKAQLAENRAEAARLIEEGLITIARMNLAMLATALPGLCATHGEKELRFVFEQILPAVRLMPELRIRVHPALRERVEREISGVLDAAITRTVWSESDSLRPGDIVVSWQQGSACRDTRATCSAIQDCVLGLFHNGDKADLPEQHHGE